jgi:hypothetical protein
MHHEDDYPEGMSPVEYDVLNESEIPWTWDDEPGLPFSRCIWCNQSMEVLREDRKPGIPKNIFVQVRNHMATEHPDQWAARIFHWLTDPQERGE